MGFLGEIRLTAFGQMPPGWEECDGRLLNISQNQPLFSILGTTYGGDGIRTFAIPDLRGRVPIHRDNRDFFQGYAAGEETHALTVNELPPHIHPFVIATAAATGSSPAGVVPAAAPAALGAVYGSAGPQVLLAPAAVSPVGNGAPHNNMQPYMALVFMICVDGVYPSQY